MSPSPRRLWLLVPLAYILFCYGLTHAGLLGPDEPRYASIGRQMAVSGDWVTPRLWGEPWFEKPALLYWMTGAAFRLGLPADLAPRLPVALLSVAFLAFFWWALRREFGDATAWTATLMLGTMAGWIGYSSIGVTDLPLAATFSAAMLLALAWVDRGDRRGLPAASALLGLAVLAKGLVALGLVLPLFIIGRARWRDLLDGRVIAPFLITALPWYIACYLQNGSEFLNQFFIKHHLSRFTSDAIGHPQPAWYYLLILPALLLPWTPVLAVLPADALRQDRRIRLLVAWLLFGFVIFSASANKLPGYVLPLLPAAAALGAVALQARPGVRWPLAATAGLLLAFVLARDVLPVAVAEGLSRAPRPTMSLVWLLPVAAAAAVWWLDARGRRDLAVLLIASLATLAVGWIKATTLLEVDRRASPRTVWRKVADRRQQTCIAWLGRNWLYGFNYYSVTPLPDCAAAARPLQVTQNPGAPPMVIERQLDPPSSIVIPSPFR